MRSTCVNLHVFRLSPGLRQAENSSLGYGLPCPLEWYVPQISYIHRHPEWAAMPSRKVAATFSKGDIHEPNRTLRPSTSDLTLPSNSSGRMLLWNTQDHVSDCCRPGEMRGEGNCAVGSATFDNENGVLGTVLDTSFWSTQVQQQH